MAKYAMLVYTNPKSGRDAEYNDWYDNIHLGEVCAIPGINAAKRFEVHASPGETPDSNYLAIYELDCDDPGVVMAELQRRSAAGEMNISDSLDAAGAKVSFFRYRD
jgi:hypothetical protein